MIIKLRSSCEKTYIFESNALIMKNIYKQLDIDLKLIKFPTKRAITAANRYEVDGELSRVAGLSKQYKNLIQIPIPINSINITVFSKNAQFVVIRMGKFKTI